MPVIVGCKAICADRSSKPSPDLSPVLPWEQLQMLGIWPLQPRHCAGSDEKRRMPICTTCSITFKGRVSAINKRNEWATHNLRKSQMTCGIPTVHSFQILRPLPPGRLHQSNLAMGRNWLGPVLLDCAHVASNAPSHLPCRLPAVGTKQQLFSAYSHFLAPPPRVGVWPLPSLSPKFSLTCETNFL